MKNNVNVISSWTAGAQQDAAGRGLSLRLMAADEAFGLPVTLTGQVYGFGETGGNRSAEEWFTAEFPQVAKLVEFDSEQGQFFAYGPEQVLAEVAARFVEAV